MSQLVATQAGVDDRSTIRGSNKGSLEKLLNPHCFNDVYWTWLSRYLVFLLLLLMFSEGVVGDKQSLIATIDIPHDQRYLVRNKESPRDFITCTGKSPLGTNSAEFRVDLYLTNEEGPVVHITKDLSQRIEFECTPSIPTDTDSCILASQVTCTFGVISARTEDSGTYYCQTNPCSSQTYKGNSDVYAVGVYDRVILNSAYLESLSSTDIPIGRPFKLRCVYQYTNQVVNLTLVWVRDNVSVRQDLVGSHSEGQFYNFDYDVKAADEIDSGSYYCLVYGSDASEYIDMQPPTPINISVSGQAVIDSFTSSPYAVDNNKIVNIFSNGANDTLDCTANGIPNPNITLALNGSAVAARVSQLNSITKTLILPEAGRDNGNYCCIAVNYIDGIEKTAASCLTVKVNAFPEVVTFSPTGKKSCLLKGQSVEITCISTGLPQPHVSILSVNITLLASGNGSTTLSFYTDTEANLTFLCQAENRWNTSSLWRNFSYCSNDAVDKRWPIIGYTLAAAVAAAAAATLAVFIRNKIKKTKESETTPLFGVQGKEEANVNQQLALWLKKYWTKVDPSLTKKKKDDIENKIKQRGGKINPIKCAEEFLEQWTEGKTQDDIREELLKCDLPSSVKKNVRKLFPHTTLPS